VIEILFFFLVAMLIAGVVMAIVARTWVLETEPVVWRGIDVPNATNNLRLFFRDIDDAQFAYPTGQFVPDDESDDASGTLVMREDDFKNSSGLGWSLALLQWGAAGGIGAVAAGAEAGVVGFFIGAFFGVMIFFALAALAVPLIVYGLIDMAMRPLMRSRITADVKKHASIPDAVEFTVKFRGLSAFGLVGDAVEGITAPKLPPGFAAGGIEPGTTAEVEAISATKRASGFVQAAERRFHVIFYSGVVVAALAAVLLYVLLPSSPGYNEYAYGSGDDYADTTSADDGTSDYGESTTEEDSSSSADSAGSENSYEASDFSVSIPADWVSTTEGEDQGEYSEWRFEPSDTDVRHLTVDTTSDVSATPGDSASGVRDAYNESSDFSEIAFTDDGDSATWEFINDGRHVIDKFFNACGDGYAILYSAPEDEFDESEWSTFADSFSNTCEEESSTSEDSSETEDSSNLAAPSNLSYSSSTRQGQMEKVIRQHWQARLDGNYSTAYKKYADPLRAHAGEQSNWEEMLAADGLNTVDVVSVKSLGNNKIAVHLTTESDKEGCKNWHFVYTMKKVSGHWRMADQVVDRQGC
jgi:hypothetical protein